MENDMNRINDTGPSWARHRAVLVAALAAMVATTLAAAAESMIAKSLVKT
jgi:hypothetical protein